MSRKRIAQDREAERPLWGDRWTMGSFWDALFAVRARIRTAALALADTEAADTVGIMLEETAADLKRLADRARGELDEGCGR